MLRSGPVQRLRRLLRRGEFDCNDVQSLSSDYIDDSLKPSLSERFRHHLEDCHRCNSFVATLRATILTLRDLPRRPVPPGLRERVRRRIQEECEGQSPTS